MLIFIPERGISNKEDIEYDSLILHYIMGWLCTNKLAKPQAQISTGFPKNYGPGLSRQDFTVRLFFQNFGGQIPSNNFVS